MRLASDLVPTIDDLHTRQRLHFPELIDEAFWDMYEACKPYSLVHVTGFYNLYQSLTYLNKHKIVGHAVECGCFLGGVAAFMGLFCNRFNYDLKIWLFDTFEGPPVGSTDVMVGGTQIETPCKLPNYEEQVRQTLTTIVGSTARYRFVVGPVEDTLPKTRIGPIALLRLDTDFYSSTQIELELLYPRLVPGGVLIVDDYGTFAGSRQAVDEYMGKLEETPLLNRIDIGIWTGVKPAASKAEPAPFLQSMRRYLPGWAAGRIGRPA